MVIDDRLRELNIELPPAARPVAAYVPAVRTGNLVYTSGQIPTVAGELRWAGKVDADVSREDAYASARTAALNALAAVKELIGTLDSITRIVRVCVYVNSSSGFTAQAQVANGASELLQDLFGDRGRHARSAVGMAELPLNAPVEVELVVEVE